MVSTAQTIEAVYEDNVLKPLKPLKGIMEHENVLVIVRSHPAKKSIREIKGTLSHKEAEEMQELVNGEFEKIEGEW
jgi:predicted DNA-binding antitoxin AbrB/MazE fold protein